MKMTKKKLFTIAVAVCMIAILSFSSLAWFTDDDTVTNKFQMATSSDDVDDIFSVDIIERVDEDGDGDYDKEIDLNDDPDGGYVYEDILPNSVLSKAPAARNTGAYSEYVRVNVTVDHAAALITLMEKYDLDLESVFGGFDDDKWTRYYEPQFDEEADTVTYTYYLNRELLPAQENNEVIDEETLFTTVTIPYQFTREDMAALSDGVFELNIVAEAVQSENLGENSHPYKAFKLISPTTTPDNTVAIS